jgi:hypothetical protein
VYKYVINVFVFMFVVTRIPWESKSMLSVRSDRISRESKSMLSVRIDKAIKGV